nr:hypothetical protein [Tanacetum cinerariifolium]
MGFAANRASDAFRNLSNSVHGGVVGSGSGAGYTTDTTLRLDFPGSFNPFTSSQGVKRKWSSVNGSMDVQSGLPLSLWLGNSPSSSDSKASSATGCTTMSSAKETDEESSMDIELDFSLHLGGEKAPVRKKVSAQNKTSMDMQHQVSSAGGVVNSTDVADPSLVADRYLTLDLFEQKPRDLRTTSMDPRFRNMGFAANRASDAFRNLSNSVHGGVVGSGSGAGYTTDTTLRLDFPGSLNPFTSSQGVKRKWSSVNGSMDVQSGLPLSLWLGNSPSSSDSKASSATGCTTMSSAKETDEESSMDIELDFSLHLGGEKAPIRKKVSAQNKTSMDMQHQVDLELSLFSVPAESDVTTAKILPADGCDFHMDDGSLSSHLDTRNSYPLFKNTLNEKNNHFVNHAPSSSIMTMPTSSFTCLSEITEPQQPRTGSTKTCQFEGCEKGARGASGLCIAHGGGRRCQKPGCHKGAEGRTAYCKAHGGGRRCEFLGCTKSSEGRTDYCIAHGGGRRCSHENCTRAARGKSGLCIRHGGGKRCQMENCTKSAEGLSGLCISHGGGRRCQFLACTKGAQGSTMFCKAHVSTPPCASCATGHRTSLATAMCHAEKGPTVHTLWTNSTTFKSTPFPTTMTLAKRGTTFCALGTAFERAPFATTMCLAEHGASLSAFGTSNKLTPASTTMRDAETR